MSNKLNFGAEAAELDSSFDEDDGDDDHELDRRKKRAKRRDLADKEQRAKEPKASSSHFSEEVARDEGRRQRFHMLSLSAYDRHKQLINEYFLYFGGATGRLKRDTSRDKNDVDVIRENHRFLWDDDAGDQEQLTWGQRLAKRYCQKLFKEYCICDLSKYKDNRVAMRWRTEKEVTAGKGQFTCGARKCEEAERLRTWEVNFTYQEAGEKKNALVKVRLCPDCSYKLNYHHKRKEVTKMRKERKESKRKKKKRRRPSEDQSSSDEEIKRKKRALEEKAEEARMEKNASEIWSKPVEVEQEKTRDEDFSEYLEDLFL